MKILFFSASFLNIGGVEKHALEVSRVLAAWGHDISVVTESRLDGQDNKNDNYQSYNKSDNEAKSEKELVKSIYSETKLENNLRLLSFNFAQAGFFKKFRIWFYLWKARKIMRNADIIHCHDVFIWYLPFRFLFPKKPVYVTFHGYETVFPLAKKAVLVRKISEFLANGNICVGDFIGKWYGTKADYVTYGGVNANKLQIKNYKLAIDKIEDRKLKILFVGRLAADTGIKIYLSALKLLKESGIEFEFQAVGDGELRTEVEKYGKVNGFVGDIYPFIYRSNLIFASSYLAIQEALLLGKPVIAVYDNPLKHDYLVNAPFSQFIKIAKDPAETADYIKSFKKFQSEIMAKTEKGQKWVEGKTWEKVARVYLDLWQKGKSKL